MAEETVWRLRVRMPTERFGKPTVFTDRAKAFEAAGREAEDAAIYERDSLEWDEEGPPASLLRTIALAERGEYEKAFEAWEMYKYIMEPEKMLYDVVLQEI